ncbi:MAG: thiamine-phosphate kinase [Planctomycetia bacterium]|nr:thiamine-phosphate kinase [Planctomycetia bacterium]
MRYKQKWNVTSEHNFSKMKTPQNSSSVTESITETEMVSHLCRNFIMPDFVQRGPGDDAAVLHWAEHAPEMVISVDMLTEGVDFLLHRVTPEKIGRKALAVNLSDLAAMAAAPVACVISVALPKHPRIFPGAYDADGNLLRYLSHSDEIPQEVPVQVLLEKLALGVQEMAQSAQVAIIGGDTNTWNESLVISITIIGKVENKDPFTGRGRALTRNGAKPGDKILVTGTLGGSILRKQFNFQPRITEMRLLAQRYSLHAGMDISDGLTLDLWRLLQESRCGAILDLDAVPISLDAKELSSLRPGQSTMYDWIPAEFAAKTPLEHALEDGEDFEILFTVSPDTARKILDEKPLSIPITCIGEIIPEMELWGHTNNGTKKALSPKGFQH